MLGENRCASPSARNRAQPGSGRRGSRPAGVGGSAAALARPAVDYETILSYEQLEAWLATIGSADLTAIVTHTTSLDPIAAELVGISLSVEALQACYLPLAHRYAGAPKQLPLEEVLEQLRPWLESPHQR